MADEVACRRQDPDVTVGHQDEVGLSAMPEIVGALGSNPEIVFLDETTVGLDPGYAMTSSMTTSA
jgi:ABC-type methionine transport system ATPase subunit